MNCVYLLRLYLDRGNQSADLHQPMGGQRCEPGHQQANRGTAFSLLLSQVVQLRRDIRERWNYLPLLSIQWTIGTRPDTRQARVVTTVVRQCDVLGRYYKLVNLLKNKSYQMNSFLVSCFTEFPLLYPNEYCPFQEVK